LLAASADVVIAGAARAAESITANTICMARIICRLLNMAPANRTDFVRTDLVVVVGTDFRLSRLIRVG
jgi:hypothetical protein